MSDTAEFDRRLLRITQRCRDEADRYRTQTSPNAWVRSLRCGFSASLHWIHVQVTRVLRLHLEGY